jgi:hypothetical protein
VSVTTGVPATSDPAARARRRRNLVLAAMVAVVLLAAGAMAWRWWTHPSAFSGLGDSYSSDPLPLSGAALSTTVIFPQASGSPEQVTIDGLDAKFSSNTAKAAATFWLCHMAGGEEAIGSVHDPGSVCSTIEAFKPPMRFDYGVAPDSDYLFVTLTPTRRGVAHLKAVDVDYQRSADHFYQQGTQTIRVDRTITVR